MHNVRFIPFLCIGCGGATKGFPLRGEAVTAGD